MLGSNTGMVLNNLLDILGEHPGLGILIYSIRLVLPLIQLSLTQ